MQTEERFKLLLTATPDTLAAVDAALAGRKPELEKPASLRLFRMGDAARETGLSRSTLWRAIRDGRLKTVEVRRGSHRMAEAELRRFVEGR
jgi:predicted DNA-binding transcriptional regulator AlpA